MDRDRAVWGGRKVGVGQAVGFGGIFARLAIRAAVVFVFRSGRAGKPDLFHGPGLGVGDSLPRGARQPERGFGQVFHWESVYHFKFLPANASFVFDMGLQARLYTLVEFFCNDVERCRPQRHVRRCHRHPVYNCRVGI